MQAYFNLLGRLGIDTNSAGRIHSKIKNYEMQKFAKSTNMEKIAILKCMILSPLKIIYFDSVIHYFDVVSQNVDSF